MQTTRDILCWLCDGELTPSKEHIFPKAIGGKKAVPGFICSKCNNDSGAKWDKQLINLLSVFRLEHGVGESSSAALDATSEDGLDGTRHYKVHGFNDVRLARPEIRETKTPEGRNNIEIIAGNEKHLRQALRNLKKKYPQSEIEIEHAVKSALRETNETAVELNMPITFLVPSAEKSIIKTALCWAFATGTDPRKCELAYYVMHDCPIFGSRQEFSLVRVEPANGSLVAPDHHTVAIRRDGQSGSIIAVVEYYGWIRFSSLLSERYEGETMVHVHSVDPKTGRKFEIMRTPLRESADGPWDTILDR